MVILRNKYKGAVVEAVKVGYEGMKTGELIGSSVGGTIDQMMGLKTEQFNPGAHLGGIVGGGTGSIIGGVIGARNGYIKGDYNIETYGAEAIGKPIALIMEGKGEGWHPQDAIVNHQIKSNFNVQSEWDRMRYCSNLIMSSKENGSFQKNPSSIDIFFQ